MPEEKLVVKVFPVVGPALAADAVNDPEAEGVQAAARGPGAAALPAARVASERAGGVR